MKIEKDYKKEQNKSNPILVSIILATYNNEETIVPCLSSLVKQDYPSKEIIVVNDGSTDNTGMLIKKFEGIEIINSKQSTGWATARNLGLTLSKGEVIFFAEGDAIYNTDYVSKAVECMKNDVMMGGVQVMGAPWKIRSTIVTECIEIENKLQHKRISEGKMKPFYSWVFRRSAIDSVGGFDEKLKQGEDKDIFLRIKRHGYSIGLVPGINWGHRRYEGLFTFSKKSFQRGKTRILFLFKHKKTFEAIRNIAPLWLLFSSIFFSLIITSLLINMMLILLVLFILLVIRTSIVYWDCTSRKRFLLILPFFKISRYSMFSLGYSFGLVKYLYGKILGRNIDWQYLTGDIKKMEQTKDLNS